MQDEVDTAQVFYKGGEQKEIGKDEQYVPPATGRAAWWLIIRGVQRARKELNCREVHDVEREGKDGDPGMESKSLGRKEI
jgi:hypothetical protein